MTKRFFSIILVIIILMIIGYMVWENQKQIKEMFIDKATDAYENSITSIFETYVLREPNQAEVKRYRKMMANPNDTGKVISELKKTDEYQGISKNTKKSHQGILAPNIPLQVDDYDIIDKRVEELDIDKRTRVFRIIIGIYDKTLERMPTMQELRYYTMRMVTDNDLTEDQLRKVLESSREFKILKRNQSNQVYAELPLNATNQQLDYEVEEIYRSVMGFESADKHVRNNDNDDSDSDEEKDKPLDYRNELILTEEMLNFLKQKYIEYELNEDRLKNLIKMIHRLDSENVNIQKIIDYQTPMATVRIQSKRNRQRKNEKENRERIKENKRTQKVNADGGLDDINQRKKEISSRFDNFDSSEEESEENEKNIKDDEEDNTELIDNEDEDKELDDMEENTEDETEIDDGKDLIEGYEDNENDENDDEMTPEMKELRRRRQTLVKQRFQNEVEKREEKEETRQEEIDKKQDKFDNWMDKQNRKVRNIYADKNEDAIEDRQCDFTSEEREALKKYGGTGELIENVKNRKSLHRTKKMKNPSNKGWKNKKKPRAKFTEMTRYSQPVDGNEYEPWNKNCITPYEFPIDGNIIRKEPYNICDVDPFHVIHNKTREVYNKKRNGLAYMQNERNKSELSNICGRQYLNADHNMKLFPEYKWSVPQKRPPVCIPERKNNYHPMMAQTALIGTLLHET